MYGHVIEGHVSCNSQGIKKDPKASTFQKCFLVCHCKGGTQGECGSLFHFEWGEAFNVYVYIFKISFIVHLAHTMDRLNTNVPLIIKQLFYSTLFGSNLLL